MTYFKTKLYDFLNSISSEIKETNYLEEYKELMNLLPEQNRVYILIQSQGLVAMTALRAWNRELESDRLKATSQAHHDSVDHFKHTAKVLFDELIKHYEISTPIPFESTTVYLSEDPDKSDLCPCGCVRFRENKDQNFTCDHGNVYTSRQIDNWMPKTPSELKNELLTRVERRAGRKLSEHEKDIVLLTFMNET